jgi:hypothetical protein
VRCKSLFPFRFVLRINNPPLNTNGAVLVPT